MANFNIGIDCPSPEIADKLRNHISGIDLYQDGLDCDDGRVSLVSKQGLLDELKSFAKSNSVELAVEVWPEDMDYDEADESDNIELHQFE